MLIVSKFHDYYDSGCYYGVDKTCVFNRVKKVIEVESVFFLKKIERGFRDSKKNLINPFYPKAVTLRSRRGYVSEVSAHTRVIGFCGNIYPVILVEETSHDFATQRKTFYDFESYWSYAKDILEDDGKLKYRPTYNPFFSDIDCEQGAKNFFDTNNYRELETIFREFHTPYFLVDTVKWRKPAIILCPVLKDYEFYKVHSVTEAHQMIHQYLSGYLGSPEKDLVEIKDKDMLHKKGFHNMSFKKRGKGK